MTAHARQFPIGTHIAIELADDVVHAAMVRFDFGIGSYFELACTPSIPRLHAPRVRQDDAVNCLRCTSRPWRS
jgi:hypothetical protein